MGDDCLPAWMTPGRTGLCQNNPRKGNAAQNYFPITSPTDVEAFNRSDNWRVVWLT